MTFCVGECEHQQTVRAFADKDENVRKASNINPTNLIDQYWMRIGVGADAVHGEIDGIAKSVRHRRVSLPISVPG
jgi:hypothetical protein